MTLAARRWHILAGSDRMIQIRRRWPILAAAVAALSYSANHYQIGGIEHLRIEPRPQTASPLNPNLSHPSGSSFGPGGFTSNSSSHSIEPRSSHSRTTANWEGKLSVGEKLAMLQENLSGAASNPQETGGGGFNAPTSFPSSSPIPIPPGFTSVPQTSLSGGLQPIGQADANRFPSTLPETNVPNTANAAGTQPIIDIPESFTTNVPSPGLLPTEGLPGGSLTSTLAPEKGKASMDSLSYARMSKSIRVASFSIQSLGPAKMSKPRVKEALVRAIRQFDVVALQGIRSSRDDLLPALVELLNQTGRTFDYLIGPRVGRVAPHDQFAIVFDTEQVETDRYQLYTVDDPDDLMRYEPLVAWFRCKGVPQSDAFTFSLINVRLDPDLVRQERELLPGLVKAVRDDGRQEDDWIVAGDVGCGTSDLMGLQPANFRFALQDIPTSVDGTQMLDTLFFSARATTEFTGRSGAFDFLRKFNLSIEQAMEISSHLPIWAEFSVMEGAEPGRVAPPSTSAPF